ncbi:hypothetical protein ACHAXT_007107 [Thalassiosira profunda]
MPNSYQWIPPHRPPPADPSLAGKIARLGPVGKCLEAALDELLADDRASIGGSRQEGAVGGADNGNQSTDELFATRKRKRGADIGDDERAMRDGSVREAPHEDDDGTSASAPGNHLRVDESTSTSILEAYGKAVAETKFDRQREKSATPSNDAAIAPAALLQGEIDHFNRVGGQWRIVVKNAVLKGRSTTKVVMRKKRRTVLDWGDACDKDKKRSASSSLDSNGAGIAADVHRFPGTMQILAYDDET